MHYQRGGTILNVPVRYGHLLIPGNAARLALLGKEGSIKINKKQASYRITTNYFPVEFPDRLSQLCSRVGSSAVKPWLVLLASGRGTKPWCVDSIVSFTDLHFLFFSAQRGRGKVWVISTCAVKVG